VLAFKATLKGLDFYVNNKQQSLDIIQPYSSKEVTPGGERLAVRLASTRHGLWAGHDRLGLGYQTPGQWQNQINLLTDLQVTKAKPAPEDVMDNQFL
jgi:hypothetical protein